jgi:SH3-like domain-containing protein
LFAAATLMQRHGFAYGGVMQCANRLTAVLICLCLCMASAVQPARAQQRELPYWASLRVNEVNMRAGPSEDYRISWVYRRLGLPLKVLRIKEGWRLVEDPGGTRGWMLAQFLTRQRGAIIVGDGIGGDGPADMHESGHAGSALKWRFSPGNIGKLGECSAGWCALDIGGRAGFVEQARLWGAGEP